MSKSLSHRLFGLDVLRAVAILLVIFTHLAIYIYRDMYEINLYRLLFLDGVDLFFVLSGFLIGGILISFYESNSPVTLKTTLQSFWKRRWFRTLPLYYAILLIYIFISILHQKSLLPFLPAFFFLQNFFGPINIIFGVSWSLAVEEWFYLLLPLTFLLINMFFLKKWSVRKKFLLVILLFMIIPFFVRLLYTPHLEISNKSTWINLIRNVVIFRFDTLAFGLLGAYFYKYSTKLWLKWKKPSFLIGLGILIIVCFFVKTPYNGIYYRLFYFDILSLGILLLLPQLVSLKTKSTYLISIFTFISVISYSLYLTHMLVAYFMKQHAYLFPSPILATVFYLVVTFLISALTYYFYEKPFTDMRDK